MDLTDGKIASVVSRVALAVALLVALALPTAYAVVAYLDLSEDLAFKARVKATAFSGLIATNPDVWMYAENRMLGLLMREPVPLEAERVRVFDERGSLVIEAGPPPDEPSLQRSFALYDAAREVGRVEVGSSLRPMLWATAAAAGAGLLLGGLIFLALRTLPLRALRRVTGALFEQKQRAEVTLHSIGDAVITTDAQGRVEFLNPKAQWLSGWTQAAAHQRPLAEVLQLVDAASGAAVPSAVPRALAENRVVSFGRELDLVRPDGSRVGIDDSAAPIHSPDGQVTGGVLIIRDVSSARSQARQRAWEATHDSLTSLANRREFERLIEAAVAGSHDQGLPHVVCFMDLDQFKVVNDSCGHVAGDDLLKRVAALLGANIRKADHLARLGGDEFGLLLEGCTLDEAQAIAAKLIAAVGDFRFPWEGKVFSVGISIGLAQVEGETSAAEVLGAADTACYWAKEQGRNRVCAYRRGDSDLEARRRQVGWVARIHAALAEDRFVLYAQPYLNLGGSAGADHLEVLLRMVDEDGSLVQPGSFLPAAERYHLMPAIDRWVVRQVFARYRELLARHDGRALTCAINLSATTLNSEGFLEFVQQQLRQHALPPGAICFEITETSAINNLRHAIAFMQQCRALGLLFALDDFGMGMSSFAYLKDLPVDYLKIDGNFVRDLPSNQVERAMVEAINRIGHLMGIKTVAEYAENETIIGVLREIGVDYAQGYGVSTPQPLQV